MATTGECIRQALDASLLAASNVYSGESVPPEFVLESADKYLEWYKRQYRNMMRYNGVRDSDIVL